MTDRERFEVWKRGYQAFVLARFREGEGYVVDDSQWAVWQASRKQALEEAIEEAEGTAKAYMGHARGGDNSGASDHKADALVDFAEELRALANPEGEQG